MTRSYEKQTGLRMNDVRWSGAMTLVDPRHEASGLDRSLRHAWQAASSVVQQSKGLDPDTIGRATAALGPIETASSTGLAAPVAALICPETRLQKKVDPDHLILEPDK